MPMRINTAKRLLQDGQPAVGVWINFTSIVAAEALATIGWDWLVLDSEHGAMDLETMQAMFIAIGTTNTVPMCRVPWNDTAGIKRVLDAGAMGVVVPMVCTAEEADRAVKACRYPPLGVRSAGGGRWRYWFGPEYMEVANDEILCVVMIEHIDAVARAEEILSVSGVDACFIGPNDLAWSMGQGLKRDDRHEQAIQEVLRAAKKVGVPAGIHCQNADEVVRRVAEGFQFCACQSDAALLMQAANAAFKTIKSGAAVPAGAR
jgi:4-hydroxy-2-oxoheptanedioate aldolase